MNGRMLIDACAQPMAIRMFVKTNDLYCIVVFNIILHVFVFLFIIVLLVTGVVIVTVIRCFCKVFLNRYTLHVLSSSIYI